jgi:hypothetical protein
MIEVPHNSWQSLEEEDDPKIVLPIVINARTTHTSIQASKEINKQYIK